MAIKSKIYLTLFFLILTIILIVGFLVWPTFNRIKNRSQELNWRKQEFVGLEVKLANLEKFKNLTNELSAFLQEVNNLFVDAKAAVAFIDFLEKTAKQNNLEIDISPTNISETEKDFWPYLNFRLIITGSFVDFLRFLEKIENTPFLVEVQNVTINQLAVDHKLVDGGIKANLLIKVFVKQ